MVGSADSRPLYDDVAESPMDELAVCNVLRELLPLVRQRLAFSLILPEMLYARSDSGAIFLQENATGASSGPQGTASSFLPPELSSASTIADVEVPMWDAAYVWNLGVVVYTLMAGYPPFASTSPLDSCPFFADFRSTHRLACPEHFTMSAIRIIVEMLCLQPEQRISLEGLDRACDEWRRSVLLPPMMVVDSTVKKLSARGGRGGNITTTLAKLAIISQAESATPSHPTTTAAAAAAAAVAVSPATSANGSCSTSLHESSLAALASATSLSSQDLDDDLESEPPTPLQEARRIDHPATATAVLGPHGASADEVRRSMLEHPNSPHVQKKPSDLRMPSRPVAVFYSPVSLLPRKIPTPALRPDAAKSNAPGRLKRPGEVRVKRLGWLIKHEGDGHSLLSQITAVLDAHGIRHQLQRDSIGAVTENVHSSDGMGPGSMQASIVVTALLSSSPLADTSRSTSSPGTKSTTSRWRIDVARFTGDTFQFHAFYRSLRDWLHPILFLDAVPVAADSKDKQLAFVLAPFNPAFNLAPLNLAASHDATNPTPLQGALPFWGARREAKEARSSAPDAPGAFPFTPQARGSSHCAEDSVDLS